MSPPGAGPPAGGHRVMPRRRSPPKEGMVTPKKAQAHWLGTGSPAQAVVATRRVPAEDGCIHRRGPAGWGGTGSPAQAAVAIW